MELNLQDWIVKAFLIKKDDRKSVSEEEYFSIINLNIDDELKIKFKDILKEYICNKKNNFSLNLNDFYEFMSDDSNKKKYKITKYELAKQNTYFNNLLEKISIENNNLANENYLNYYYIVLKFFKKKQEIFYFRKINKVVISAKDKFLIFTKYKKHIEEIKEDIIYFDNSIDFIFFNGFLIEGNTDDERTIFNQKILIFNRKNFKTLLRLYEYCITKSTEFFNNYEFLDIADIDTNKKDSEGNILKLKDTFIQNHTLNSQITRIYNQCKNEITFNKIKKLKDQRGAIYGFKIEGEKIKIERKKDIKDLLDLIDEKIATPDWDKDKVLKYHSKGDTL